MRRYSEAVKADVRRRMSPPHRQSVARISEELGIHLATLYNWRKAWRLQGEVVPSSEKEPEGWSLVNSIMYDYTTSLKVQAVPLVGIIFKDLLIESRLSVMHNSNLVNDEFGFALRPMSRPLIIASRRST